MLVSVRRWVAALALTLLTLGTLQATAAVASGPLDGFDPGLLVTDEAFYDADAMTREEVKAFIDEKGAGCSSNTATPCLKDYRADTPAEAADAFCTTAIRAAKGNDAAGIIHSVATACGINPQMLLVVIQKESSLVAHRGIGLSPQMYARATGASCRDYEECDSAFATFFGQVYWAAHRFQEYRANPNGYPYRVRAHNEIPYNPEASCGTADVAIRSQATAGLYIYTPYVPNAPALAKPYGEGDLCSTYGNRNFFVTLKSWFPDSAPRTTGAPVAPTPPSTVTPALAAIYEKSAELGLGRTGPARSDVRCTGTTTTGPCFKRFSKLSLVWTARDGVRLGLPTPSNAVTPVALRPFTDVARDNQFHKEITWLAATKIGQGWPDNTFRPLNSVNRDAMAAFLYRAAGSPDFTPPVRPTFRDVARDNQFYKEIEWLAARGISTGWDTKQGKEYRPVTPVNRDAMAAFLYRSKGSPSFTVPRSGRFTDVPPGTQFRKEMEWLAAREISTGWPDKTYRPLQPVNRDAMAAFLYRSAA
ncbi:MAG: S-layer homology domain-containing protein [Propionibacteriaceae bacterium]|nr:S-layer homology domain-containing protein [Propionibacteriaceae bacterium]